MTTNAKWTALTPSDYGIYDTVRDNTLEWGELTQSGKFDEFVMRFIKTPVTVARESYVGTFTQTLLDKMRERFVALKIKPDENGLGKDDVAAIDYWLEHDMKARRVIFNATEFFYYERAEETTDSYGAVLSETLDKPSFGVSDFVRFEVPFGKFKKLKWFTKIATETTGQNGTYSYEEQANPAESQVYQSLYYFTEATSWLETDEAHKISVTGYYKGQTEPMPDKLSRGWKLGANGRYAIPVGGKPLSASVSGSYVDMDYAAPLVAGLPTMDYRHASVDGKIQYQSKKSGVVFNATYYDIHSVTSYETMAAGKLNGQLIYNTTIGDPEKRTLTAEIGAGGERYEYATSLTDLAAVEGNVQGSGKLMLKLVPAHLSLTAYGQGAAIHSDGSLVGWYGALQDSQAEIQYDFVKKDSKRSLASVALYVGANYYERELDYVGDEATPASPQEQSQILFKAGPRASYTPADWIKLETSVNMSHTDQKGFLPVDSFSGSGGLMASVRLSKREAPLSTWLYTGVYHAPYSLVTEGLKYEKSDTEAWLNVTVQNF